MSAPLSAFQPIEPTPSAEHLRAALVALWPDRPKVYLQAGQGDDAPVLTDEEQQTLGRVARAIAEVEVAGYRRGHEHAEATVPGADRGALVDVLGALNRLGLDSVPDDQSDDLTYAPATILGLRDAVRRAHRRIDRSPE